MEPLEFTTKNLSSHVSHGNIPHLSTVDGQEPVIIRCRPGGYYIFVGEKLYESELVPTSACWALNKIGVTLNLS